MNKDYLDSYVRLLYDIIYQDKKDKERICLNDRIKCISILLGDN